MKNLMYWEVFRDPNLLRRQNFEEPRKVAENINLLLTVPYFQKLCRKLGVDSSELTPEMLAKYNVNTLQVSLWKHFLEVYNDLIFQVILNDFSEKLEQHPAQLVSLLMHKADLQNEQDNRIADG